VTGRIDCFGREYQRQDVIGLIRYLREQRLKEGVHPEAWWISLP
jgi:hypothetical protein